MKRRRALLLGLAAIALAGCNMIIGNDVHELAHDDASSSQGGAGTTGGAGGTAGGQGGDAGQGGRAGQGGSAGQGGNPPDDGSAGRGGGAGQAGSAGRDAATGDGAAGSVNRDVSTGSDADIDAPAGTDGTIQDGKDDAVDACSSGSKECRGRSVYLCTGGQWVETIQCPYACVTGVCSGLCVPGTTQCSGNAAQTCDDAGQWQNSSICPYICSQGACTGMCTPGTTITCGDATTCNAGAFQTCDSSGTLGPCMPAPSTCLTIPAGWQAVALTQAPCPSGFGSSQTVYTSATGAPYSCTCGCSGVQGCAGTATLEQYASGACAGVPTSTRSLAFSPACTGGSYGSIIANNAYLLSNVVYGPSPTCGANPTAPTKPPVVVQSTNLCFANATCPSGACLSQSQSANLCVAKQGMQSCPPDYPTATVVSTSYDDTRGCGACTCGSGLACTLSGVVINNDSSVCSTGHSFWMTTSTSCAVAPSSYPANAVQATSTSMGDPSCVETSPSNPEGGVTLHAATTATVCCK